MERIYANKFTFAVSNGHELYVKFSTMVPQIGNDDQVIGVEQINSIGVTMSPQPALEIATKVLDAYNQLGYNVKKVSEKDAFIESTDRPEQQPKE